MKKIEDLWPCYVEEMLRLSCGLRVMCTKYLAIWETNNDAPSKRWEPWIHREVAHHCELAASSWYQRWTGSHRGVLGRRSPWPLACCCRLPLWMVPPPAGSAPEPSEEPKGHACTCTYREMVNIDHRMYIHVYMCTYYGKKFNTPKGLCGRGRVLHYCINPTETIPGLAWQAHLCQFGRATKVFIIISCTNMYKLYVMHACTYMCTCIIRTVSSKLNFLDHSTCIYLVQKILGQLIFISTYERS